MKKKNIFHRNLILSFACSICMMFSTTAIVHAEAAEDLSVFTDTPMDINDEDMFMKQTSRGTCTLLSNTMMLKRKAALDGRDYWETIDETTVRPSAWLSGVGIRNSYTFENYKVTYASLSGSTEEKKEALIELLEQHPEGIAAYDNYLPHAILLTDYDANEDMFYCSDPADYYPDGRYSILDSYLGDQRGSEDQSNIIANIYSYWYISETIE